MCKVINLFNREGDEKMDLNRRVYNVIDIAKYVINKSIELGSPISNLKLQKILYFIQGKFLSDLKKPAFLEDIEAWKHGPVVPEVYYEFNKYIANKITCKFNDVNEKNFNKRDLEKINEVIEDKCEYDAWDLVKITHMQSPWKDNYQQNENAIIPVKDIEKYFSKEH